MHQKNYMRSALKIIFFMCLCRGVRKEPPPLNLFFLYKHFKTINTNIIKSVKLLLNWLLHDCNSIVLSFCFRFLLYLITSANYFSWPKVSIIFHHHPNKNSVYTHDLSITKFNCSILHSQSQTFITWFGRRSLVRCSMTVGNKVVYFVLQIKRQEVSCYF